MLDCPEQIHTSLGLPYEPHLVSFQTNDQLTPEFISLNPNNKIPAILDPNGPDGQPLALFESGAILLYLAAKCGRFLPDDLAAFKASGEPLPTVETGRAVGEAERKKSCPQYCDACFTGEYPTRLTDLADRESPDQLSLPVGKVA